MLNTFSNSSEMPKAKYLLKGRDTVNSGISHSLKKEEGNRLA